MMARKHRAVTALIVAIAVVAVVACVLSASDNEAALQEVGLPANKAAVQGRLQRPMDSTVVERATSAALMHDIGAFLMRRASSTANVMRKRMAQAHSQHTLAPMQQLYTPPRGYYKDPAFALSKTTDPDFKDDKGDPAFARFIPHSHAGFARAVEQGEMLEKIGAHMQQAEQEEMTGDKPDEDDEIDMDNRPRAPSWDNVLDKVQKAWDAEKPSSGVIQHGTFAGEHVPAQTQVTNVKLHRLNHEGRIMSEQEEVDDSLQKGLGKKESTPAQQTPGQPDEDYHYGPLAKPEKTVTFPIENESKGEKPFGGYRHLESNMEGAGTIPTSGRIQDLTNDEGQANYKDPAFNPPNTPKPMKDETFGKDKDPAFTRNVRGGELVATKTAVQLAKKAMAEHAKKTTKAPKHSSKHGFDLSKQAAVAINQVKINQLKAATARKERKYKKAMAMVEKTKSSYQALHPIEKKKMAQKMGTVKYIKH